LSTALKKTLLEFSAKSYRGSGNYAHRVETRESSLDAVLSFVDQRRVGIRRTAERCTSWHCRA